jgi:hypothetical protein
VFLPLRQFLDVERDEFTFYVAGVETSVAHCLHSLRWNMGNHSRDKVEGRASDGSTSLTTGGDALPGLGVDVPIGDELTVVVGDVRSGEWGVTQERETARDGV